MAPWKWPFLVLAIAVSIALAFYLGGPGLGLAVGALVAVAVVYFAVRAQPREALGVDPAGAGRERILVVVGRPVEDEGTIAAIAARREAAGKGAEVLVLAPARMGFLDRWASDLEKARRQAQRNLVITVASLAKAGVEAEARVGDEDLVQAVADTLGSFAATEVVLVTAEEDASPAAAAAQAELEARLRSRFVHLTLSDRGAR